LNLYGNSFRQNPWVAQSFALPSIGSRIPAGMAYLSTHSLAIVLSSPIGRLGKVLKGFLNISREKTGLASTGFRPCVGRYKWNPFHRAG
jgi:hypothetical protein